jgi:Ca2+-transporting ATPase
MQRPPRKRSDSLFNLKTVGVSVLQGIGVLGIILGVMAAAKAMGHPVDDSQTAMMFTTLVIANVCMILANRSCSRTAISMLREPNTALWWVVGGAAAGMGIILNVPFFRQLFHFTVLGWESIAICALAGSLCLVWFELLKIVAFRRDTRTGPRTP